MRGVRRPRRGFVEVDIRDDRQRDHDDERRDDDGEGDDHRYQEGDRRDHDGDNGGDGLIVLFDRELDEQSDHDRGCNDRLDDDDDDIVGIIGVGFLRDDDEQRHRTCDDHDLDVLRTGDDFRRLLELVSE